MNKISEMFQSSFSQSAIQIAMYIKKNKAVYKTPTGLGFTYTNIIITDNRYCSELVMVNNRSLL